MMQINEDYYERLTEEKFDRILADLRRAGRLAEDRPVHVAGTRGARSVMRIRIRYG